MPTWSAILPPRPSLAGGARLTGLLVVALLLVAWSSGGDGILPFLLGVVGAVSTAAGSRDVRMVGAILLLTAGAAGAGAAFAGDAPAVGVVVALTALAGAPLNAVCAGSGLMVPVVAATIGTTGSGDTPLVTAAWTLAGAVAVVGLARALKMPGRTPGVERERAWRHGIVTAVLAGAATWVVVAEDLPHGYWLVTALCASLRPVRGESVRAAVDRVTGTLAGAVLAAALVLVLPPWAIGILLLGCLVVALAWTLAGDQRRSTMLLTPVVVLSGGVDAETATGAILERVAYLVVGAVLAVAAAAVLAAYENRAVRDGGADQAS